MILFAFKTDKGEVREKNEDAFGYFRDEFFVVADGLGGHPGGEIASKLAVEAAIKSYQTIKNLDLKEKIKKCFREANKAVYQKALELGILGMGTTLVGVGIKDNDFLIGNVGDGRAYLLRNTLITQITRDQETDFEGFLLQAIGLDKEIRPDYYSGELKQGDLILLCTDGLADYLKDEEILGILKDAGQTQKVLNQKAKELINKALDVGGDDNITVCVVKVI